MSNIDPVIARLAVIGLVGALAVSPALAEENTGSMTVRARITASCTIDDIDPMQFGTLTASAAGATTGEIHAQSELRLTCTDGADWTVIANDGLNSGGTAQRRVTNASGTATVNYDLALDASQTMPMPTAIADAAGTDAAGIGDGNQQSFTIYGSVPAGQLLPADGAYSDTVTFTINF